MNIIGKIYKTVNILSLKNGFNVKYKVKRNFGGVNNSHFKVIKNSEEIIINIDEKIIAYENLFENINENEIKNISNKIDISLKNKDLIKPDAYNLKIRNIQIKEESNKGIIIPIIIETNLNKIISILKLTPCIYNNEDYIKLEIKGDYLPIKVKSNEKITLI